MKPSIWYPSETRRIYTSCGHFYVTTVTNPDEYRLVRVLISAGRTGGCAQAHLLPLMSRLSEIFDIGSQDDRMKAYTEMTSIWCHMPDNCVSLTARYIMEEDLSLIEFKERRFKGE